jgi:hypothetical protein
MECVNPLRAHHRARYRYCCYQRCSLCICIIVAGYASITSLWILAVSNEPSNQYMHPFLYLLHVYRSLVFYTFVPAAGRKRRSQISAPPSYLHRITAALYTFPAFEANDCTRTYYRDDGFKKCTASIPAVWSETFMH